MGRDTTIWLLAGLALLASVGWLVEYRRRRALEHDHDSVLWADVLPPGASIVTTAGGLSKILPDSPNAAQSARAVYLTSRREATLIDLHQLNGKLTRRLKRGDNLSAMMLLQEHLLDFRYTSPWVFLELREQYRVLEREKEWELAQRAFRARFGQNAPAWDAPSTAEAELCSDPQLAAELAHHWPYRDARMSVVRWMLGDNEARQKCSGPPVLELGVYREMLLLDTLLDEVMETRTEPADSLL